MGILIICLNLVNLEIGLQAGCDAGRRLPGQLLLDNPDNDNSSKFLLQRLRIPTQSLTREVCSFIQRHLIALQQFTIYGNSSNIPRLTRTLEFFRKGRENNPTVTIFIFILK